jgi:hypothetical protein
MHQPNERRGPPEGECWQTDVRAVSRVTAPSAEASYAERCEAADWRQPPCMIHAAEVRGG